MHSGGNYAPYLPCINADEFARVCTSKDKHESGQDSKSSNPVSSTEDRGLESCCGFINDRNENVCGPHMTQCVT